MSVSTFGGGNLLGAGLATLVTMFVLIAGTTYAYFDLENGSSLIGLALLTGVALALLFSPLFRIISKRVLVPIAVGILFFVSYDWVQNIPTVQLTQEAFAREGSQLDLLIEIFNATVSTVYALLIAFMVFKSMQDHDNINITLRDEAVSLDFMSRLLDFLIDGGHSSNIRTINRMHNLMANYAENILSDSFRRSGQMQENREILDALWDCLGDLKIEDDNDRVAFDQLLSRVDQLTMIRSTRISNMVSKPSPFMILMVVALSFFVIAPFYLPVIGGETIGPYLIAGLGFGLTFLYSMVVDMSSHFDGYWQIDRQPFAESLENIKGRTRE